MSPPPARLALPAMRVTLLSVNPSLPDLRLVLPRLPIVLGRGPEADLQLHDCWVSRRHCEISELDGELVVRDLDSRNGTIVNGQAVSQWRLLPGDRLTLGLSSFEVQYKSDRPAAPVLPSTRRSGPASSTAILGPDLSHRRASGAVR